MDQLRKLIGSFCITMVALLLAPIALADSHNLYELRTYTANEGKISALHDRFRNHTMKLFEKHGIKNVAYWSPVDKPDTLVYLIAHKNGDAAKASWGAFVKDPKWQEVYAASIADGALVANIVSVYMSKTDYSPGQ